MLAGRRFALCLQRVKLLYDAFIYKAVERLIVRHGVDRGAFLCRFIFGNRRKLLTNRSGIAILCLPEFAIRHRARQNEETRE